MAARLTIRSSRSVIGYMKPSQGFDWRDLDRPPSFLFLIRIAGSLKALLRRQRLPIGRPARGL
ncbi:hypothetical protein GCM10008965_00970 [Methylorubrum aminovorans]|nr:hypothetical protein GCM10025880_33930 [Methylorubrum aminovorans]GMA77149.1 hypothetical protein GCM10025880_35660 [Methylorubrum aminovorans]GMA77393.1 hypothetical protein GCM10025880_38100 [Methylorubrum aminovorans]GMA77415.1 hypothetical protein GCM10025880_38320 [Methylorubrum aminovorans]GMA77794.1 hypothetical protein GCM10025880_42110 [Methylorubrum aminovorans]